MSDADDNAEAIAWLAAIADSVIDTPAARVALVGDRALKVKKAVDFGFMDFSSREKRRTAILRELELNLPTAPDLYLRVRELRRDAEGRFSVDGAGEAVEAVLEMRRFAADAVLASRPESLDGDLAEALGREIARRHVAEPVNPDAGGTAALSYTVRSNAALLTAMAERLGPEAVRRVVDGTDAVFARLAAVLEKRRAAGQGRRCHGDLHLGNILVEDGRPVLFDCIEFNDTLTRVDVLYDLAFLLMDLRFRDRGDAAVRVLSGWIDEALRFDGQALSGFEALPLFMSVRAAVRSHVEAEAGRLDAARAYLAAAEAHLAPRAPTLLAVGGLSGSGKSTYARRIAPAHDAAILRSDEVRKRLWRVGPRERLPADAYAPGESVRVYDQMLRDADALLAAGQSVVLDGVFLRPEERDAAERLARRHGASFDGVWLDAPAEVLRARVTARIDDASDADARVVDAQLTRDPGPMTWTVLSAP